MSQMEQFENILLERMEDGVATLTLNRPAKMNSFTRSMAQEIKQAWSILRDADDIRAIVLRAAEGRAFCTGVDVTELWPDKKGYPFDFEDPGEYLGPKSNRLWKPIITAVHGIAAGGAFYFLNESDIVICSPDAQFFDPHVSFGLVSAVEPIGALRHVPYQQAMRMVLMGNEERIGAETALRINLVTEIVEKNELWSRAETLARSIASKPAAAIQGTVKAMWETAEMPLAAAVRGALKYTQIGNPIGLAEKEGQGIVKVPWVER